LREANEGLVNIFESISDGFIALDDKLIVTYFNKAAEHLLGRKVEEVLGHHLFEAFPEAKGKGFEKQYTLALREKRPVSYETYWNVKPYENWYELRIYPYKDGISIYFQVTTERKNAEKRLKSSHEELRALSAHLQSIREEERTLIAREIHDELGQALTGLKMDLSWLFKKLPEDQKSLFKKIESMSKLIDATIQRVRKISTELRPGVLDDFGLIAALEWQSQDFQSRTGIKCKFNSGLKYINIDPNFSTAVFRIFQETLTNIARHANASKVRIYLKEDNGSFTLRVEDNGRGIREDEVSNPKSLGIMGMRERALFFGGELKIFVKPGKGTTVTLKTPLQK
jgi:PAS domain S-box-containing protein